MPTPPPARTIIVPLDGSEAATVALPVAKTLAELEDATPHIVHVAERRALPREVLNEIGRDPEQLPGSVLDLMNGSPAEAIVRASRELNSAMIVMCSHTGVAKRDRVFAPVVEEVLRTTVCPVVLVPPERGRVPWTPRAILLPYDGSPRNAQAIGRAAEIVRRLQARVDVLYAVAPHMAADVEEATLTPPRYVDQQHYEMPAWAAEFVERLYPLTERGAQLHLSLVRGEAGPEIVKYAATRRSDLVVLEWRGVLGTARAETVKHVTREARGPVMVVRTMTEERAAAPAPWRGW
jgi:nucleotide-binding universal stress UspA family protein